MKKTIFLFIMILALLIPVHAQRDEQGLYQHKVKIYGKMKTAGWTMAGFGGGLAVTGTILLATLPAGYWNADYDYTYNEDYDVDDDLQAAGGIICLGLGIGLMTGGIILGSIGTKKEKFYKAKLDNLSIAPVITPKVQGFTLVYRF